MHGHPNNPLSITALLFIVYHGKALSEGRSNKIKRIGGTWNGRQLEMSTTSTFCVYEVCILKNVVFLTPEFSQLLQVLLVSLSFLLVCTFLKSNDMSSHVELQSSEFDLNNRNIQTVNRGETLADFTFRLIHPKLQF